LEYLVKFNNTNAEVFVPHGEPAEEAIRRSTHIAFGAHQDDIEILAMHGILHCIKTPGNYFTAVVIANGSGSEKAERYTNFTDEQMQETRWYEQRAAASIGHYSSVIQLKHTSSAIKDPDNTSVIEDLDALLQQVNPSVVYTHNLADKHPTHIGVVTKVISSLRKMPPERRPAKVYGVEVWRNLDWMPDAAKVALNLSGSDHLAAALLGLYDSQIVGGKRYDLASLGRWRANATYHETHGIDTAQMLSFAMDLAPLIHNDKLDIIKYATGYVEQFRDDIISRLSKYVHR
jgi:LmbE family N-acetylglucosaminyl deacetylase